MVLSRKSQHQRSSSSSSSLKDKLSDHNQSMKQQPIPTSRAYSSSGGGGRGSGGDDDDPISPREVGEGVRNSNDRSIISGLHQSSSTNSQREIVLISSQSNNINNKSGLDDDGSYIYIDNNNDRSYSSAHSSFPHRFDSSSLQQQPIGRPQLNPLVRQTTTASIALLFALLIWRSLTSFELASQFMDHSVLQHLSLLPSIVLLITNIIGFLCNIIKPYNFKNHLKVILAINIVREWIELVYSLFMVITWSSTSSSVSIISRETYFGSMFMNIWWCVVCFSFSRSRWVLKHTLSNSEAQYLQQQQLYEQQQQRRGY